MGLISSTMLIYTNILPPYKANLSDFTWEEISKIRKAGKASNYFSASIGSSKNVTISYFGLDGKRRETIYRAILLDVKNDFLTFSIWPEQTSLMLGRLNVSTSTSSKVNYPDMDLFSELNNEESKKGIYIADVDCKKYCLNMNLPYVEYNTQEKQYKINDGSLINGPLYLPSFSDYNFSGSELASTYNLPEVYKNNIFNSKNFAYEYNEKIKLNIKNLYDNYMSNNNSRYLITRDIYNNQRTGTKYSRFFTIKLNSNYIFQIFPLSFSANDYSLQFFFYI